MRKLILISSGVLVIGLLLILLAYRRNPFAPVQVASLPADSPSYTNVTKNTNASQLEPAEVPVQIIPLAAPLDHFKAEISGLAWYGDELILLPQFPDRMDHQLFALAKADILSYLENPTSEPLVARPILLDSGGIEDELDGYEGFEAITFMGDRVVLTIESKPRDMLGYLVFGSFTPELDQIILDETLIPILPQADIDNLSDESIFIFNNAIYTLYEANGANVNPTPIAHRFSLTGESLENTPLENIEYRITDAAPPDSTGLFWTINTFFILDQVRLYPAPDPIAARYGQGPTHAENRSVERLVAFQITPAGIILANLAPIQLQLDPPMISRNWEGLALLDERGLLLASDKLPGTLLGFVPWPKQP
jgi:hypothetical protein